MKAVVLLALFGVALARLGFQKHETIDGQYFIRLNEKIVRTQEQEQGVIKLLESQYHVYIVKTYHISEKIILFVKGEQENVDKVAALPLVRYVSHNSANSIDQCQVHPAPETWGLDRIDQREALPYSDPESPSATYTYGEDMGTDVFVYVLDTGIEIEHPEFGGRAIFGEHFTVGDRDGNGHGTHCAGTVGSNSYGVAKDVTLVAVKVLGDGGIGLTDNIIDGLNWVLDHHNQRGAELGQMAKSVVSMSIGGGPNEAYEDTVDSLIDAGISVVVSAGNSDTDACTQAPARVPRAITVGATDVTDTSAWFTNYGDCVDLFAPGVDVKSTWINGGVNTISGTSMSCPHGAGLVARHMSSLSAAPSPAEVDIWLKAEATADAINWFRDIHGTSANLLLYGEC